MSDLINRQDAIDTLDKIGSLDTNADKIYARELFKALPSAQPEIIQCKECKHFEYDHIENVNGIPLIVAHEICMRWCEGVKTSENGYCFLAERRDNE